MKKEKETITLTMEQILTPLSDEQLKSLTHSELLVIARNEQRIRMQYEALHQRLEQLEALNKELQEEKLLIENRYVKVKSMLFDPKSERQSKDKNNEGTEKKRKGRGDTTRLPSERYPNAKIIEKNITLETLPTCQCCQGEMEDSGMTETSEYLTVIPKQYLIVRQHRHKYRCPHCHGDIQTAPALPRILPGSSYSDGMIIDAALAKFCDLIPMERYCAMAKRQGFEGLPPHSLINAVSKLALFLFEVYKLIRKETLNSALILGDETRHRMLEGSDTARWYLWCFSSATSCFFEYHDTRAGEVATNILTESQCSVFMSDAYQGYGKAIREANLIRKSRGQAPIVEALCNAHARRGFKEPKKFNEENRSLPAEAKYFLDQYEEIYKLEKKIKGSPEQGRELRASMKIYFENMHAKAEAGLNSYSSHSAYYEACQYYLNQYHGLTRCLDDPSIPLDNNQSERQLRNPVVGRKTWYGTHSEDAAQAAAVHQTLVESCKLCKVNPRAYYDAITKAIQMGAPIFTPSEFAKRQNVNGATTSP